jgi:thiol-disulfide isomerase/thioredoxin
VRVEIAEGISGEQTATFWASGDHFGSSDPHEWEGEIVLEEVPENPDLAIEHYGYVNEYKSIPLSQATFTPLARIVNRGAALEEETYAYASSKDYEDSVLLKNPFTTNVFDTLMFGEVTFADTGVQEIIFEAHASNDFDESNGVSVASIHVNENRLVRDNGVRNGYYSVSHDRPGGMMGNVFTITQKDTLNSVEFVLGTPKIGQTLKAVVLTLDENGVPDQLIEESLFFSVTEHYKSYEAYFSEGVVLEPGRYFVGVLEGLGGMSLAATTDLYTPSTCYYYSTTNNIWGELNLTFMIRPGFGTKNPNFDISFEKLSTEKYVLIGGKQSLTATIYNSSIETIESFSLAYTINGGEQVSKTIDEVLEPLSMTDIVLTDEIDVANDGEYDIEMYVSPHTSSEENSLENNSMNAWFYAMEEGAMVNVVAEEGTGTWCGYCPRGFVYMDSLNEKYEDQFIPIAVHVGDVMMDEKYGTDYRNETGNFPSGILNRNSDFIDPQEFETEFLNQLEALSPAQIGVDVVSFDRETRKLKFTLTAYTVAMLNDVRFDAVIVENGIYSYESWFDQNNYYSGGQFGPLAGWESKPNPVPAAEMVYDHVGRLHLGDWQTGIEGSIPNKVEAFGEYSETFEVTLDEDWNPGNIEIVGMLIDPSTGVILNAGAQHSGIERDIKVSFNASSEDMAMDGVKVIVNNDTLVTNYFGYSYKFFQQGDYSFKAILPDGSINEGAFSLTGQDTVINVISSGVAEDKIGQIEAYPNPFQDKLTLENLQDICDIEVYSIHGIKMYSAKPNGEQVIINTGHFENGIYVIQLTGKNKVTKAQVIVKR